MGLTPPLCLSLAPPVRVRLPLRIRNNPQAGRGMGGSRVNMVERDAKNSNCLNGARRGIAPSDLEQPLYQQIAKKAAHLRELGLSLAAISRRLEVDDKTVAKAVRWLRSIQP